MALLIENACVVVQDRLKSVLDGEQIVVERGVIAAMGKRIEPGRFTIDRRIDCTGKIVIPGLINTHSHLTEILQRSFRDNARMETWRVYRALTEDEAHLSAEEIGTAAELACAEMLKSGVTAVVDHFSTRPGLSVGKMEAILGAFKKTGIRGVLAASLRDQDFIQMLTSKSNRGRRRNEQTEEPWREEVLSVVQRLRQSSEISAVMLGPTSPLNCSERLLREVNDMGERLDLGVHTHLLETRLQRWAALRFFRKGLCAHLRDIGFLSSRLSAAHSIWLEDRDPDLLAASGTSVAHNPASNLKLGSGIAPIVKLKKRGVNVSLGTDGGDTSDTYSIFEQARLAAFLSRVSTENPDDWITALDALRMATINGAQAIPAWRGKTGSIKPGLQADLVILAPTLRLRPTESILQEIVFCEGGQSVDMVLVAGKIVVEQGRLTTVDEEALIRRVEPIGAKMRRLYGRIKKRQEPAQRVIRTLYKRAFK